MGQYYTVVCPETNAAFSPSSLGGGIKALEIFSNGVIDGGLAILCKYTAGSHDRDLPWIANGLWSGKTPLMVGDYCENDDLLLNDTMQGVDEEKLYEDESVYDLTDAFKPVFERVLGSRYCGTDINGVVDDEIYLEILPVCLNKEKKWEIDYSWCENKESKKSAEDYYKHLNMDSKTLRDPIKIYKSNPVVKGKAPDIINKTGEGENLVWVNLDKKEYIDPKDMGLEADLFGICNAQQGSGAAVCAMITHMDVRGGGDFQFDTDPTGSIGRWRGDHIILIGDSKVFTYNGEDITRSMVTKNYLNITSIAEFLTKYEALGFLNRKIQSRQEYSKEEYEIIQELSTYLLSKDPDIDFSKININIIVPKKIQVTPVEDNKYLYIPGNVVAFKNNTNSFGKIFIDRVVNDKLNSMICNLPETTLILKSDKGSYGRDVLAYSDFNDLEYTPKTNHAIMDMKKV